MDCERAHKCVMHKPTDKRVVRVCIHAWRGCTPSLPRIADGTARHDARHGSAVQGSAPNTAHAGHLLTYLALPREPLGEHGLAKAVAAQDVRLVPQLLQQQAHDGLVLVLHGPVCKERETSREVGIEKSGQ